MLQEFPFTLGIVNVKPDEKGRYRSMRPGVYILLICALLFLFGAFLIFVLPGLVSNTAYVTFTEKLVGSGVYEDGIYLGNGNDGVYRTEGGSHTYTFTFEGIEYGKAEVKLKKKVFFSLFSHSPVLVEPQRTYTDELRDEIKDSFIRDISIYSAVLEHDENFHFPSIFSSFASNAVECGISDVRDIWLLGASHISGKELYEDYLEGKRILEENNILFSSPALLSLEKYLPSMAGDEGMSLKAENDDVSVIPIRSDSFFAYYGSGEIEMGRDVTLSSRSAKEAPIALETNAFAISKNLVTEAEWALFVKENPMWSPDNKEELIKMGLVDDNYLKGITLSKYIRTIRPIRNISHYAAEAYVEWLGKKDGVEYSIPTEAEWTMAAKSAESKDYVTSLVFVENNNDTPTAMLGQLWEFTSTPFVPLSRLSDYTAITDRSSEFGYDDVIIKGGSFVSDPSAVTIHTVGIASRNQCSEFCGLRVAKHE